MEKKSKSSRDLDLDPTMPNVKLIYPTIYSNLKIPDHLSFELGMDHLIFRGGWDFFEKNSLFLYRSEKNLMSSMKLKIKKSFFFIQ